jgi:hypothetical protein
LPELSKSKDAKPTGNISIKCWGDYISLLKLQTTIFFKGINSVLIAGGWMCGWRMGSKKVHPSIFLSFIRFVWLENEARSSKL